MKLSELGQLAVVLFVATFLGQIFSAYVISGKPNNVSRFNVTEEAIAKDLDGRALPLGMGQIWPFESSQNIKVTISKKKPLDEYVVVIAEITALAPVDQTAPAGPKEQFSTSPSSKDTPKSNTKLPTKLQLRGTLKLTYEVFDSNWYLISAENLTLRAFPLD
jgi:hypothetical protein